MRWCRCVAYSSGPSPAFAQVGKSLGVVDANTATEQVLAAAPNMTAPIVKALIAARPFNSMVDLNKFLLSQKLTQEQASQFYGKGVRARQSEYRRPRKRSC